MNHETKKLMSIVIVSFIMISLFLLIRVDIFSGNTQLLTYQLNSRMGKLGAMIVTATAIGISTVIFQTITQNKILTPSIIGLDAIYLFIQTFIVYIYGAEKLLNMQSWQNYLISLVAMAAFALILFKSFFHKKPSSIFFMLLSGVMISSFFHSLASFMQLLIDPNDFLILQATMFASFNAINVRLLGVSILCLAGVLLWMIFDFPYLDLLLLGREKVISLGVDYDRVIRRLFIQLSLLIAIATALTGPVVFLGLLVSNMAYQLLKTYRHMYTLVASVSIGVIFLLGGQIIIEHIIHFSTSLSVLINLFGGLYFILLLLKENR